MPWYKDKNGKEYYEPPGGWDYFQNLEATREAMKRTTPVPPTTADLSEGSLADIFTKAIQNQMGPAEDSPLTLNSAQNPPIMSLKANESQEPGILDRISNWWNGETPDVKEPAIAKTDLLKTAIATQFPTLAASQIPRESPDIATTQTPAEPGLLTKAFSIPDVTEQQIKDFGPALDRFAAVFGGPLAPFMKFDAYKQTMGSLYRSAGGKMTELGKKYNIETLENTGKPIMEFGDKVSNAFTHPTEEYKGVESLLDPDWWARNKYTQGLMSLVPYAMATVPPTVAAGAATAATAPLVGLGAGATAVATTVASTVTGGTLDSALESGDTYAEALKMGKSSEEAIKASDQSFDENFLLNTLLAGLQYTGFLIPRKLIAKTLARPISKFLKSNPFTIPANPKPFTKAWGEALKPAEMVAAELAEKPIMKVGAEAARVGLEGASEAFQEGMQTAIQRQALGTNTQSKWEQMTNPDQEMKDSMVIGGLGGLGFGGAGTLFHSAVNSTNAKMSVEGQDVFWHQVQQYTDKGMPEPLAFNRAMIDLGKTLDGHKIVQSVLDELGAQVEAEEMAQQETSELPNDAPVVGTSGETPDETSVIDPTQGAIIQNPVEPDIRPYSVRPDLDWELGDQVHSPSGGPAQVVDNTDPATVTIKDANGSELKIGRKGLAKLQEKFAQQEQSNQGTQPHTDTSSTPPPVKNPDTTGVIDTQLTGDQSKEGSSDLDQIKKLVRTEFNGQQKTPTEIKDWATQKGIQLGTALRAYKEEIGEFASGQSSVPNQVEKYYHGSPANFTHFDDTYTGGLINLTKDRMRAWNYGTGSGSGRRVTLPDSELYAVDDIGTVFEKHGETWEPIGEQISDDGEPMKLGPTDVTDTYTNDSLNREISKGTMGAIPKQVYVKEIIPRVKKTLDLKSKEGIEVLASLSPEGNTQAQIIIDMAKKGDFDWGYTKTEAATRHWQNILNPQLEKLGYDSIKFSDDGGETLAVFHPSQVNPVEPAEKKASTTPTSAGTTKPNNPETDSTTTTQGTSLPSEQSTTNVPPLPTFKVGDIISYKGNNHKVRGQIENTPYYFVEGRDVPVHASDVTLVESAQETTPEQPKGETTTTQPQGNKPKAPSGENKTPRANDGRNLIEGAYLDITRKLVALEDETPALAKAGLRKLAEMYVDKNKYVAEDSEIQKLKPKNRDFTTNLGKRKQAKYLLARDKSFRFVLKHMDWTYNEHGFDDASSILRTLINDYAKDEYLAGSGPLPDTKPAEQGTSLQNDHKDETPATTKVPPPATDNASKIKQAKEQWENALKKDAAEHFGMPLDEVMAMSPKEWKTLKDEYNAHRSVCQTPHSLSDPDLNDLPEPTKEGTETRDFIVSVPGWWDMTEEQRFLFQPNLRVQVARYFNMPVDNVYKMDTKEWWDLRDKYWQEKSGKYQARDFNRGDGIRVSSRRAEGKVKKIYPTYLVADFKSMLGNDKRQARNDVEIKYTDVELRYPLEPGTKKVYTTRPLTMEEAKEAFATSPLKEVFPEDYEWYILDGYPHIIGQEGIYTAYWSLDKFGEKVHHFGAFASDKAELQYNTEINKDFIKETLVELLKRDPIEIVKAGITTKNDAPTLEIEAKFGAENKTFSVSIGEGGINKARQKAVDSIYSELKNRKEGTTKVSPPPTSQKAETEATTKPSSQETSTQKPADIPIEDRDFENVGNRKINSIQFNHPELKPYIQNMARMLLGELDSSIKGQRFTTEDEHGETHITGQKRFVSKSIERILDQTNATYADIEDALKRIINDEGSENIALAKRIELVVDDNLTDGYTSFDGYDIPPDQEYIDTKKRITETQEDQPQQSDSVQAEQSEVQQSSLTLADYGMNIKKTTTKKGTVVWQVGGDTYPHKLIFHNLKGRWYKPHPKAKGVWSFTEDPTEKLLAALPPIEGKAPVPPTPTQEDAYTPAVKIANWVQEKLEEGKPFTSLELYRVSDEAYGGTQATGKYQIKDAYDAMELGINKYLAKHKISIGPLVDAELAIKNLHKITEDIISKIPTMSNKRTAEQDEYQQFSTPPHIAYIAAWVANITKADVVLEPSAGIGGLAVFAKMPGAKIIVNEYSPRRAEILREMGFDRVFTENAEQLNNILPADVKPTTVIMNPPFSSTAGRMQGKRDTKNATLHIEQALKRLQPNGRLVAIVGKGMADNAPAFREWWSKIKQEYNVRANVGIDGKNYAKYGASFGIQLFVIDKTGATPTNATVTGLITDLEEAPSLLEGIKNARISADKQTESDTTQPKGQVTAPESEGETGPNGTTPVSTGGLGTGTGQGGGSQSGGQQRPVRPDGNGSETNVSGQSSNGVGSSQQGGPRPSQPQNPVGGTEENAGNENTGGSSSVSGRENNGGTRSEGNSSQSGVKVETTETENTNTELTEAVFQEYTPQKLKIAGAKPHPGQLAQSAAMAAVEPPAPTYNPNLPTEVITEGKLSLAQLEPVVYAGQAHEQILPDGTRKGFFDGDGTGVGKGRIISGIILDNFRQGRKKAIWVSANAPLFADANRDFGAVGGDTKKLFELGKTKLGNSVKQPDGILFTTYSTLGVGYETTRAGQLRRKSNDNSTRLDQIVEWLGEDFDGIIAFDEAHKMANSTSQQGSQGKKPAATMALAGVELQRRLPNARVIYFSATGATEVSNLAYAERLGLWGDGTAFGSSQAFIDDIQAGGLAAMELVARDMKAMGVYLARNLDYTGVEYATRLHELTPEQTEIYDTMARAWQIVLRNIYRALDTTSQGNNGTRKGRVMGAFWTSCQRFYNQILTSMQMPTVIAEAKKDLADGHAIVMQLVNTNEAAQNRQLAKQDEDFTLEDMDLTPRETLMEYLDRSFPTQQYEDVTDDKGNTTSQPVYDSMGNPVENREAVEMKEQLMNQLGAMKVPEGPLEMILNAFGTDNVAEITGRGQRVVDGTDKAGRPAKEVQKRTPAVRAVEADEFQEGKRLILVFSDAGGTGRSYHAEKSVKNQRRRMHYLIQAGWRADNAVQGFGRTHRTNQTSAPYYKLFTTNLRGQKRFISSIARRLDQLGALTKGQRDAGSQGLFSAKDNLESSYARQALERFYTDLVMGRFEDLEPRDILTKMGLTEKLIDEWGNLKNSPDLRNINKFLNRILTLESGEQNKVFDLFSARLDSIIESAIERGDLDTGVQVLKADRVKVLDEQTVHTDESTTAETKYFELEVGHLNKKVTFAEAQELRNFDGFFRNTRSERVYARRQMGQKTDPDTGAIVDKIMLQGQAAATFQNSTMQDFENGNWEKLNETEAERLWNEALAVVPEYRTEKVHLMSGALLPIWNRLPKDNAKVIRVKTDDGRVLLGRVISERHITSTLRQLGADRRAQTINAREVIGQILNQGYTVYLSNGWRLIRRTVSGEPRIEIAGNNVWQFATELQRHGVITERIRYDTRFFIPTGANAERVFKAVIEPRPISEVIPPDNRTGGNNSGGSLGSVEQESGEEVDRNTEPASPPAGLSIKHMVSDRFRNDNSSTAGSGYTFEDAETEEGFQRGNKGQTRATLVERVIDGWITIFARATREFEFLPHDPEFSRLRFDLLKLQKQKGVASDRVVRLLQGVVLKMDESSLDLFTRKVLLDDLSHAPEGEPLPFKFTPAKVERELKRLDQELQNHPEIERAIQQRKKIWSAMKNDYIRYMKAIGLNVEDRFTREDYFRHQILEYAQLRPVIPGTGSKLKTPKSRGWLRERHGSDLDINVNYLQAEYEVMAQMLYDIEVAKTINAVDKNYNIRKETEREAKSRNDHAIEAIIRREKQDPKAEKDKEGNPISPTEYVLKKFRQRIAIAFDRLQKLADSDLLWVGDKHQWEDVVESLANSTTHRLEEEGKLFRYLTEIMNLDQEGASWAGMIFNAVNDRKRFIEMTLGDNFKTWEDVIPEGYTKWQPREGNHFYLVTSIPEKIATQLYAQTGVELGVDASKLRKVLAMGSKYREFVIKTEIADTLNNMAKQVEDSWLASLTGAWKQWVLLNPRRLIKYNIRNLTGDADAVLAGNPRGFLKVPQATRELYQVFYGDRAMTEEMREWFNRGGMQTLLQVQELGDINQLRMFVHLKGGNKDNLPTRIFKQYWQKARLHTDFREAILRYANYLSYLEQIQNSLNGLPKNYGASIPEEVMALDNPRDQAFKLSNELLGAYDAVSALGKDIRRKYIPFWSYQETNFRRYTQMIKNASRDEKLAGMVGRRLLGAAVIRSPYLAIRTGSFAIKATGLWIILQLINNLMFPDEEKELPKEVSSRPHIILGRNEDGSVKYFSQLGSLGDFLGWFGLDTPVRDASDFLSGRRTIQEIATDMVKKPVNKVWQGLTPAFKLPAEYASGRTFYPDVFKPGRIRDYWDKLARDFSMENEFRELTGRPHQPYRKTLNNLIYYSADPLESDYWYIFDEKDRFMRKLGKSMGEGGDNERSNALRNFRTALRFKDMEAAKKYLEAYGQSGGTKSGLSRSLESTFPLYQLSDAEKRAFINSLTKEDKERLINALRYYQKTYKPSNVDWQAIINANKE